MSSVIVVIGAGSIGHAIARRVSAGKHVLLADLRQENADAAAKVLKDAGFLVTTAKTLPATYNARPRPLSRRCTPLA
jgi:NAD(P)-dependent dehydrogenase (short-subunit alcohol dehydrogenase family)